MKRLRLEELNLDRNIRERSAGLVQKRNQSRQGSIGLENRAVSFRHQSGPDQRGKAREGVPLKKVQS